MKKLTLLCLLIGLTSLGASAQFFQWATSQEKSASGTTLGSGSGTSLASGSNLLATTGTFYQNITLGSQTFTGTDSMNAYLAVHDHAGNILWAKHIISHSFNRPSVNIDANQNIIIAGTFSDSLHIGSLLFKGSSAGKTGVYVVKFSAAGSLLWARSSDVSSGSSNPYTSATSVSTDGTGNVFVAGDFNNSLNFNGTNLTSTSGDAFLVKYDVNGLYQWAIKTGGNALEVSIKVKAASNGDIYLTNTILSPIAPNSGCAISKFNSSGTAIWSKILNIQTAPIISLAVDNMNNVYITGYHNSTITIGNTTLIPNPSGCFLAKLDVSGNLKWAKAIASQLESGGYAPSIYYSPANRLAIAGEFYGTAQFNNISITSGPSTLSTFVTQIDTAGTPLWANNVSGSDNTVSDLSGDINGNFFISGEFYNGNANFSATTLSTNSFNAGYLAKVTNEANAVAGTVFVDSNSNGILDASEKPYEQLMLETTPGPIHGISAEDGTYQIYLPTGNSTVSLSNPPRYYTPVPASHNLTFSGTNQILNNKDFALQPIPNSNDVQVTVTNITPARPGFALTYRITFHNSGTTTLSDTLKFNHNTSSLNYTTASVAPLSNSNGKMAWYYQNLQPRETRNIDITFSVPTTAVLGTNLMAVANIKPFAIDLLQADNNDTLNHVVVGSYDPNDKEVNKTALSPTVAANGDFLEYIIRFQNTGTDTAFTVVVTDKINTQLKLSDFEMLSASHNYKLNITEGNTLEWHFNNILLPDSKRNEPASHGFVRFRIKTKAGLILGDSIANQAGIYFDYNTPVITNYAITRVSYITGINEEKTSIQAFKLYPNPAKNYVMVEANLNVNTNAAVSLVNLLGQTVSKVNLPANNQIHYQLPLNDLPKGVYLIRLETETGVQTQRLVIQ